MPLPKPNNGEDKDKFISRCMGNPTMNSEYPKSDQRYGFCMSQWSKKFAEDVMADKLDDWIEIFRAGDYRKDNKGNFTVKDLHHIAKGYDPTYHEAGITKNHDDKETFGWVDKLKVVGNTMLCKFKQITKEFREEVKLGKWKKRSPEFYPNLDGKGLYLRAVSFVPFPYNKGLQPHEFTDEKGTYIYIDFDEPDNHKPAEGGQEMDEKIIRQMLDDQKAELTKTFDEKIGTIKDEAKKEVDSFKEEIKKLKDENKSTLTKLTEAQAAQIESDAVQFFEGLKREGKLPPAIERNGAKELYIKLASMPGTIKFSETETDKDGKEIKKEVEKTPLQAFKDSLTALPKFIEPGVETQFNKTTSESIDLSKYSDEKVDADSVKVAERTDKIMKANEKLSYGDAQTQAFNELKKEGVIK